MTNIVSFPKDKINEAEVRFLLEQGDALADASRNLAHAISEWENRFLIAGERYLSQGGNDPTLVKSIAIVKATKKFLSMLI